MQVVPVLVRMCLLKHEPSVRDNQLVAAAHYFPKYLHLRQLADSVEGIPVDYRHLGECEFWLSYRCLVPPVHTHQSRAQFQPHIHVKLQFLCVLNNTLVIHKFARIAQNRDRHKSNEPEGFWAFELIL